MNSYDDLTDLAIGGNYVFFTGTTRCINSPYTVCPDIPAGVYCDQSYNPSADAFIARFSYVESNGINEVGNAATDDGLFIYPNPSSGMFTVRYINQGNLTSSPGMTITDQLGRIVSTTSLKLRPGENTFKIDMVGLANGIYFLEIINGGRRSAAKFVKR